MAYEPQAFNICVTISKRIPKVFYLTHIENAKSRGTWVLSERVNDIMSVKFKKINERAALSVNST